MFERVVDAQASLVARWMLVGFIHGVMNTDNMTISGETIDYGPCAFMDAFDPATVFSSIDHGGRYAYGNQPHVAQWNLARLAETLLPLSTTTHEAAAEAATDVLQSFPDPLRTRTGRARMRAKLGLADDAPGDDELDRRPARAARTSSDVDFTSSFRRCSRAASRARDALRRPGAVRRVGRALAARCSRDGAGGRRRRWTASTRSTSRATTSSRRR